MRSNRLFVTQLAVVASLASLGCGDGTAPATPGVSSSWSVADNDLYTRTNAGRVTSTARWNAVALEIIPRLRVSPIPVTRTMAYLTVAQSRALRVASEQHNGDRRSSLGGAVAGASVVVLGYLFPSEAERLEGLLAAQGVEAEVDAASFAAGVTSGRAVGAAIVAEARTDNFDAVWTGTVPTGEGIWFSSLIPPQAPVSPMLGQMRPFYLRSPDQFRPKAPPAFGSREFISALDEVRQISDTRTPEQDAIAKQWALSTGTISPTGYFNQLAIKFAGEEGFGERRTANVLALMNTAMMDAYIGCWDAKYVYWLLRPIQADPGITLAIPMANHPSYPSGHSCISSAAAEVLGATFRHEKQQFRATAAEIGLSRIYAGVHYRFDIVAADALGVAVAKLAIKKNRRHGR